MLWIVSAFTVWLSFKLSFSHFSVVSLLSFECWTVLRSSSNCSLVSIAFFRFTSFLAAFLFLSLCGSECLFEGEHFAFVVVVGFEFCQSNWFFLFTSFSLKLNFEFWFFFFVFFSLSIFALRNYCWFYTIDACVCVCVKVEFCSFYS